MKFLVDDITVPIGRQAMKDNHACHMLDPTNMPIIDSFDKFLPDICVLSIDKVDEIILERMKEYPHINLYLMIDTTEKTTTDIIEQYIGNNFYSLFYENSIWDSLLYPETIEKKSSIEVYLDGFLPVDPTENTIRIFDRKIIDSEFYCGYIEEYQKYEMFRTAKKVKLKKKDYHNASACGCIVIGKENQKLNYKENDSYKFYQKILGTEKCLR